MAGAYVHGYDPKESRRLQDQASTLVDLQTMIEGVRESALGAGLMGEADFDQAIADLYRTAEADGVFCYTFFKASAVNDSRAGTAPAR